MLNCKQASELVSQSLDQQLSWSNKWQLKLHLLMCRYCKRFYTQMLAMRQSFKAMHEQVESDSDIKLSTAAKEKILNKLKD